MMGSHPNAPRSTTIAELIILAVVFVYAVWKVIFSKDR
jgi:hypothetical protein